MELEALPKNLEVGVLASVNEVGNRLEENKSLLKQWIKCQPHLPSSKYDERILDIFLRGCKHDLEKTKKKIDMYFTCRGMYPQLFSARDPFSDSVQQALDTFYVIPLPLLTSDGYRITFHRFADGDPAKFDAQSVFQTMLMIADIRLLEEPAIAGDIFLFDVTNISAAHFAKIATPLLKYTLQCAQDAYPQRLKEIHLFNTPQWIDRVISFFKQFLKDKMKNRFHVHANQQSLYRFVSKSRLPQDYGGDLKSTLELQAIWKKKLKSYKMYFEQQETIKVDESKRPISEKNDGSYMFGCNGAFRKLQID